MQVTLVVWGVLVQKLSNLGTNLKTGKPSRSSGESAHEMFHFMHVNGAMDEVRRVQVWSAVRFHIMSIVIIAEKPSVAEDLANVLGVRKKTDTHWHSEDIIITWAVGHLLELKFMDEYDEAFKNWRKTIDRLPYIPATFEYKPKGGRNNLRKQTSRAQRARAMPTTPAEACPIAPKSGLTR